MAWFAPCYDTLLARAEATWLGELRRETVAGLRGSVIEIGAGTGANLRWYPRGAVVHAVEPDPDMRARLIRRAQDRPATRVVDAQAEALPFADGTADAVVATLVFCSVADVQRAVDEVFRVLRPGGELRFVEHVAAPGWRGALQRGLDPAWRHCAGACRLHRDPRPAFELRADVTARECWPWAAPPFLLPVVVGRAVRR